MEITLLNLSDASQPAVASNISPLRRSKLDLFLVSFAILFLELACIRWFGSTVVFLTFFTNIVLLATFLGMSVGCLAAARRANLINAVIPLLLLSMALACGVLFVHQRFGQIMFDVGGQGSPQQIYFGTEYSARDVATFIVPIEVVGGIFFVLVALLFVGLGQIMGRAFNQIPNRVAAYTLNIAGSLLGIAVFALLSWCWIGPVTWFAIALLIILFFKPRPFPLQLVAALAILFCAGFSNAAPGEQTIWSPYYKIWYQPPNRGISTNNIGHQAMSDVTDNAPAYSLPHLLNRDSGNPPFRDVLIIGAGSGNDVAAALHYGAQHVDAVEIDPVIYRLGCANHPNHPYSDPRVTVHIDDGRSFLRRTDRHYDLIVYALVDSLVLHSGYTNLRLESFLFTEEAFADVRSRLKPGGVFAAYNYYRQGWLVGRLHKLMKTVFGRSPIVMALPFHRKFVPYEPIPHITFMLASVDSRLPGKFIDHISGKLFWLNRQPSLNETVNAFSTNPPTDSSGWLANGPSLVDIRPGELLPHDDWPFLYLRDRVIPEVNIRGLALIAICSLILLLVFLPRQRLRPNWNMFFLGAGFMLLETKSVVHLALLFGSTWMVNSIVFFAILVMILCSNLFVLRFQPARLWPSYLLLGAMLLLGILIPMNVFLHLPATWRVVLSCAIVFAPVFFAGIIFAARFRDSETPDVDFASNIAGAILGGLSEPLSLLIGFNNLLVVALIFYALSIALSRRAPVPVA